jgi:hypothetical protein
MPKEANYRVLLNAIDTDVTWQAGWILLAMAGQEKLFDLYNFVQVPFLKICRQMHEIGIKMKLMRETPGNTKAPTTILSLPTSSLRGAGESSTPFF